MIEDVKPSSGTAANEPVATAADFDADSALSRDYLLRRGRCCQEACRNCPYGFPANRLQDDQTLR